MWDRSCLYGGYHLGNVFGMMLENECLCMFFVMFSRRQTIFFFDSCLNGGMEAWTTRGRRSRAQVIPWFKLTSDIFSSPLRTKLGLHDPMVHGLFRCICGHAIDPTWIHLFRYVHGGKHTTTHDAVWDSFISIVRNVKVHVLHEQTHVFPMPFL